MSTWLSILVPSAIIGLIVGYFSKGRFGSMLAGAIPWFGLLAFLLYHEYVILPNQGHPGGASMWPIAQLFAGTIAALSGIGACYLSRAYKNKSEDKKQNQ